MNELRDLLANTVQLQARFLAQRMEASLPKMLESAPKAARTKIKANFDKLAATRVAAVGPVVAEALERHGVSVHLVPAESFFLKPLTTALERLFAEAR
jgi:uroporphyrinogen-III synthase